MKQVKVNSVSSTISGSIMRKIIKQLLLGVAMATSGASSFALDQYASSVIGFSSEYTSSSWAASQALGAPDTFAYGDIVTAWAPGPINGSFEYITLGFGTAVYATGATVRETYGNGFVYQIDALDSSNVLHTVWTGTDNSLPGSPVDASFSWAQTSFLVQGLKIYTDTNHDLNAWEEIDSVTLSGSLTVSAVPEPETYAMMLAGLGLLGFAARRRKQKQA
jgi:PEP-CTERM motif